MVDRETTSITIERSAATKAFINAKNKGIHLYQYIEGLIEGDKQ